MENLENQVMEEMPDTNEAYVAAIKELQNNTVSKEAYLKLQADNKRLLDALVSDEKIEVPKDTKISVDECRKKLFNKDANLSNLEYIDTALKLRTGLIERGERDPFLPVGNHVNETSEMYDKAQRVADLLQECVDYADGDSGVFTARYQSLVKDTQIPRRGR